MRISRLFLTVLLASGLAACTAPETDPAATKPTDADAPTRRVVQVETITLEPGLFEDVIQITGTLEAPNDATLSAQSGGTIQTIVPMGRFVRSGDVVARLDDALLRATVLQARAQLDVATAQSNLADGLLRRQEPLYRDSIISVLEFENVRSQAVQAQAERSRAAALVQQAEKQLENTLVRAPFDGTVEERFAEKGEQVMPGTAIARVVNTASIRVVAGVPERYATDVRDGSTATVSFQSYGGGERQGRISFASSVIDPGSRTFRIEIELSNPGARLKPAMIANVRIVRERMTDRLVIPQTSILTDENSEGVFIVVSGADGLRAERRVVTTGATYGGRVVIESGLSAGDKVIVVGQTNVTEGDAVETSAAGSAS